MKHRDEIKVTIKAVSDREGEYVAYYRSEFLNATFSMHFRDTIFGAIALHDFTEMLRGKYEKERVVFVVSEERMRFKSRDLLEAMTGSKLQG